MSELKEKVDRAHQLAVAAEERARRSPEHLESSLEAAVHFESAASAAAELEHDATAEQDIRLRSGALLLYLQAQACKSRGWYHYEKHEMQIALPEQERYSELLQEAIQKGNAVISQLCPDDTHNLRKLLREWELSLLLSEQTKAAYHARKALDEDRLIAAIDHYRRSAKEAQKGLDYIEKHGADPATERIVKGNLISALANASHVMVKLLVDKVVDPQAGSGIAGIPEATRIVSCMLDAYRFGLAASNVNPEWDQINQINLHVREQIIAFLRVNQTNWLQLYCAFEHDNDLHVMMKEVNLAAFKEAESRRTLRENKILKLWAIGSFWLLAFSVIAGAIITLANLVGFWITLVALSGIEALFVLIGAFILRTTGELSQPSFLQLIGQAFKFQFKSLVAVTQDLPETSKRDKPASTDKESE